MAAFAGGRRNKPFEDCLAFADFALKIVGVTETRELLKGLASVHDNRSSPEPTINPRNVVSRAVYYDLKMRP